MSFDLSGYALPKPIYRKLLILTDAWVGERTQPGSLVIRAPSTGDGLPFYWCGGSEAHAVFAEVLGKDRSLYGLCGTWGITTPDRETICALAKYYLIEILKIQPQGPYLLGGYCGAGMIAYEIAKLLREQGHEVGPLVLFDRDMTIEAQPFIAARRAFRFIENMLKRKREFSRDPVACMTGILNHKKQQISSLVTALLIKLKGGDTTVKDPELAPYQLTPYAGKVELIYVRWGLLGYFQFKFFQEYWQNLALGGYQVEIIEGYEHHQPDWLTVANIIQVKFKQAGF